MLTVPTPQSPHRLAVFGGAWLAWAGQWPLWQSLARLPELTDGRALAFIGSTAVLLAALFALLFSLLAWARVIRPALTLAVLGTSWTMLGGERPLDMPAPTLFVLLAGMPLTWLWSRPVARAGDTWTQLLNNLGLATAAAGAATAVLILSVADFSWMWLQHAELLELLGPVRLWRTWMTVQNFFF